MIVYDTLDVSPILWRGVGVNCKINERTWTIWRQFRDVNEVLTDIESLKRCSAQFLALIRYHLKAQVLSVPRKPPLHNVHSAFYSTTYLMPQRIRYLPGNVPLQRCNCCNSVDTLPRSIEPPRSTISFLVCKERPLPDRIIHLTNTCRSISVLICFRSRVVKCRIRQPTDSRLTDPCSFPFQATARFIDSNVLGVAMNRQFPLRSTHPGGDITSLV